MSARLFNDIDLHAFVDDQTGPDRREAIGAYLKTAPADAARVDLWRRQNDAVKSLFAGTLTEPVPLWLTVGQIAVTPEKQALPAKRPIRNPVVTAPIPLRSKPRNRKLNPLIVAALAFAAGLALPVAAARVPGVSAWLSPWSVDALGAFVQRAREAHETFGLDADHPVDVADTPPGSVRTWLSHRLRFAARVPDLTQQGWTLRGGRLAPGDLGPGALLVYQRGLGERLTIYVAQIGRSWDGSDGSATHQNGTLVWAEGPLAYAVMATLPDAWLARNADALRAAIRDEID